MDAFGTDNTPRMTIDQLAAAIKTLDVRSQPEHKLTDVIEIIEHLRDQALAMHEQNRKCSEELTERIAHLTKREAELAIRQRAVQAMLKDEVPAPRRYFWR